MILISDILELIDNIPTLMLYMVQGYIFIGVYNFILFKKIDLTHLFFKSIIASYIIKVAYDAICNAIIPLHGILISKRIYEICLFVFSALLGVVISLIIKSRWFNRILLKCGILRTPNENIWDDFIMPNCWIMVYLKNFNGVYYGQYLYGEEFKNEPIIVLAHYQTMDMDGEIITDYSKDDNCRAVLNLKDFERLEVVYPVDQSRSEGTGGDTNDTFPTEIEIVQMNKTASQNKKQELKMLMSLK